MWDEWIWFGLVPALAPYLFLYIWKPEVIKKYLTIRIINEGSAIYP